eukprot:1237111-Rhodomonas_salina.1
MHAPRQTRARARAGRGRGRAGEDLFNGGDADAEGAAGGVEGHVKTASQQLLRHQHLPLPSFSQHTRTHTPPLIHALVSAHALSATIRSLSQHTHTHTT